MSGEGAGMNAQTVLSIRRAGTKNWVEIDPNTKAGRRMLARFRISTNHPLTEDTAMTATTAAASGGTRLHIVPGDNVGNMGALLRMRAAAARTANRLRASARGAWGWIKETFHLQAVADTLRGLGGWVADKAVVAGRFLGTSGLVGLGMMAISSETGRSLIGFALRPVGWVLELIGKAWVGVENMLHSDKREGGVRNTISVKMGDIREYFFGTGTTSSDGGLVGRAAVWTVKHTMPFLRLDGPTMGLVNLIGAALLTPRIFELVAMAPLGILTLPAQILVGLMIVLYVYLPIGSLVSGVTRDVFRSFKKEVGDDFEAADKTIEKTERVIVGRVHDAQAEARGEKVAAHKIASPANRAARREADRGKPRARS